MRKKISRRQFLHMTGLVLMAGGFASRVHASESAQSPARERWNKMSDEEKQKLREKWQAFKSLPPERQKKIRENYRKFKSLPPERRERVKARIRKFKSLPPERRQEIRQKWKARRKNRVRRERNSR